MKFARFVSLLTAAALPAFAFAVAPMSVTGLSGQARSITDGASSDLKVGSDILAGSSVETNSGSSAELTLSNGVKLVLSPGTRLRIKQLEVSPGVFSCEVILLRGSITGDATGASGASSFTIRTTVGVASVAGSAFSVAFTPSSSSSSTSGELSVVSLQGTASLLPVNSTGPISIPAGSQGVVGAPGSPVAQVNVASASTLAKASSDLAGITSTSSGNPTRGTAQANSDAPGSTSSSAGSVNLALLSPNGEGQVL